MTGGDVQVLLVDAERQAIRENAVGCAKVGPCQPPVLARPDVPGPEEDVDRIRIGWISGEIEDLLALGLEGGDHLPGDAVVVAAIQLRTERTEEAMRAGAPAADEVVGTEARTEQHVRERPPLIGAASDGAVLGTGVELDNRPKHHARIGGVSYQECGPEDAVTHAVG